MATKTTSTKAKTKTTKKNTVKGQARTAAAAAKTKTTKKTTVKAEIKKPVVAVKPTVVVAKTSIGSPTGPLEKLRNLHLLSAGIFVLLALAAGYLIKDTSFNVTVPHMTRDALLSTSTTVFAPAAKGVFDLNLRWIVVSLLLISALFPILYNTRFKDRYRDNITAEKSPLRWLDLAITTAIMVETVALISGIQDLVTLKLIGGMMAITCGLGWLADRHNKNADKPRWELFGLSLLSGSLPWIVIAIAALSTLFYGAIRSPWYVYAVYAVTLGGFMALTYNQWQHYRGVTNWKYAFVERSYVIINLLVKAAFAIVLIVGLHKIF